MDDLTKEEKEKIIKKLVISAILLISMIIIGILLMNNGIIVNRLKGEVTQAQGKDSEVCDNVINSNYGSVRLSNNYIDDEFRFSILPVNLKITDKESGKVYSREVTAKQCPGSEQEEYCYIDIPNGTYDIEVTKSGSLKVFNENVVVSSSNTPLIYVDDLTKGDLNNDGNINDDDERIIRQCEQGVQSENCKLADYNLDFKIDSNDISIVNSNKEKVYKWYKNGSRYYGDIYLDQEDFTLTYGQTKQLTYHTSEYFDTKRYLVWNSTNSAVVSVDYNNGIVTPKKPGTAQISYGDSKEITVTVIENGSIITDDEIVMNGKETKQIDYSYTDDSTFKDYTPTFRSSNQSVVTVDENGIITSHGAGNAKITMTVGFETSKTIDVTVNDVNATDLDVKLKNGSVIFDGYEQKNISDIVDVTPVPSNSSNYKINYSIEDEEKIDLKDNVITSKKSGTTRLKIELEGTDIVKYIDINVNYVPIESFTISQNSLSFDGAEVKGIDYEISPSNALDRKMILQSSTNLFESMSYQETNTRKAIYLTSSRPGDAIVTATINTEDGRVLTNEIATTITDVSIRSVSSEYSSYEVGLFGYTYVDFHASPSNYTANHSWSLKSSSSSNSLYRTGVSGDKVWVNRSATTTQSATITVTYTIDGTSGRTSFSVHK